MAQKFLLDTNVWLDFFLDRSSRHDLAGQFVTRATLEDEILLTAIHSVKDVYFLIGAELKREQRQSGGDVTPAFARAADEVAWSCISSMRKESIVEPADESDMIEAMIMRPNHADFEDNLIIAAARRCGADFIVTSDSRMLLDENLPTVSIERAIEAVGVDK